MPVGFCCEKCYLYDENHTCLNLKTSRKDSKSSKGIDTTEEIRPVSTVIENGLLKVVIEQKDKEIPIIINLQKQLESQKDSD